MQTVEIARDGGWTQAAYPGDEDRPEFTIEFQRYTEADRLICARWESMALEMVEEGLAPESIIAVISGVKADAMARRVRNPGGELWTGETVGDVAGASQSAYNWLEDVLYRPFWRALTAGKTRSQLAKRARSLLRIQLALKSLAQPA